MSLNTAVSAIQVSQMTSRTADGAGGIRQLSSTRELGDALNSIFPSGAPRSSVAPSHATAPSECVSGLAGSSFMPTSTADISALRNAARVSIR